MAGRISIDLGAHLHIDPDRSTPESARDLAPTLYQRKSLFWSSYVADVYVCSSYLLYQLQLINNDVSFWGFYSGRPALLTNLKHTIGDPSPGVMTDWIPYTSRDEVARRSVEMRIDLLQHVPLALAQMAKRMARISEVL